MSHQTNGNTFLIEALDREGEVLASSQIVDPSEYSDGVNATMEALDGLDVWTLRVTWLSKRQRQVEEFHGKASLAQLRRRDTAIAGYGKVFPPQQS